jgi:predicted GH43/DUF377 family glycosyl hydrolase
MISFSSRMCMYILLMPLFGSLISCGGGGSEEAPKIIFKFESTTWIESPQPILLPGPSGSWNELKADTGNSLLNKGGEWFLYHSGQDKSGTNLIGIHISRDDMLTSGWKDYVKNPVLLPGVTGAWDERGVAHPSVMKWNGEYFMYYSGFSVINESIGLAKSIDGLSFTKRAGGPVLTIGMLGEWDSAGVDHPSVIHDGKQFVMAYRGWAVGDPDVNSQIGIATSSDGINFYKRPGNPVLKYGPLGSWDTYGLLAPRLWFDFDGYRMNYSGKSAAISKSGSSIGHAYASNIDNWIKSSKNPIIFSGNTKWQELEWGTTIKIGDCWKMLTTAWVEGGATVLWHGSCH